MKLADYVIQYLRDYGIKKVFVVYGAAIGNLIDAFSRIKGIEYVCVMHEQAGAFAAEAYAKVTGQLGCCIVTSGPGGTNLLTGMANCYYDSTPCLFITGQINSQFLKKDSAVRQVGFQENDIVAMSKPITKMATMVTDPNSIKYMLQRAIYEATSGRPGPVLIDIPIDVQKVEINENSILEFVPYGVPTDYSGDVNSQIAELLVDLQKTKRPVLLVGGGIRTADAVEDVRRLGIKLGIPCLPTWNAIDIFTSDYEFYRGRVGTYGGPGRNFAIQNADLLLTIGTRISGRITGGNVQSFARGAKKYIVDVDKALLEHQEVKGDVNIHCDAKHFIRLLLDRLVGHDEMGDGLPPVELPDWQAWLDKTREWLEKYQPVLPEYYQVKDYIHPYVFMKTLSEELEVGDIIIADCGGNVVVTYQGFETKYGQRVISSHGNSPMGFSFAGAIGACLAPNVKRVICLIGDGGFNMNIQELQTLKTYRLSLKTFIMNNHCYGITRQFQETNYGSRYLASGPDGYKTPDFIPIVSAYGIEATHIDNPDNLRQQIREVINCTQRAGIVCDVNMGMFSKYEPRIFGWNTPIEDMYPYLDREKFRENMLIEPVKGWEHPTLPSKSITGWGEEKVRWDTEP